MKIHAVDLLKAMLSASKLTIITSSDEQQYLALQAMLDLHPSWTEYKDQSHDLYLTVSSSVLIAYTDAPYSVYVAQDSEKTDYFLLEDAAGTKFAGLITDGSDSTGGLAKHFNSTNFFAGEKTTASSGNLLNEINLGLQHYHFYFPPSSLIYLFYLFKGLFASFAPQPVETPTAAPSTASKSSNPLTSTLVPPNRPVSISDPLSCSTPPLTSSSNSSIPSGTKKFKTVITKSESYGIGLDIGQWV